MTDRLPSVGGMSPEDVRRIDPVQSVRERLVAARVPVNERLEVIRKCRTLLANGREREVEEILKDYTQKS